MGSSPVAPALDAARRLAADPLNDDFISRAAPRCAHVDVRLGKAVSPSGMPALSSAASSSERLATTGERVRAALA
jgi:hypothetical protein